MAREQLSTAESRRPEIVRAGLREFSRGGYRGTTVADVAREAGISSAYVFKLFSGKEQLFVAALKDCFAQIAETIEQAAAATAGGADAKLDAMGAAYAGLIADRSLLLIQVHAQSAADVPAIGDALRSGLARVTRLAKETTGADDPAVQRFIAYGQLCHLIVTTDLADVPEDWARSLVLGMDHPDDRRTT